MTGDSYTAADTTFLFQNENKPAAPAKIIFYIKLSKPFSFPGKKKISVRAGGARRR